MEYITNCVSISAILPVAAVIVFALWLLWEYRKDKRAEKRLNKIMLLQAADTYQKNKELAVERVKADEQKAATENFLQSVKGNIISISQKESGEIRARVELHGSDFVITCLENSILLNGSDVSQRVNAEEIYVFLKEEAKGAGRKLMSLQNTKRLRF
jgi:hypothetical protein